MPIDQLTAPGSGQVAIKHIRGNFKEYIEHKLPKAIERALFQQTGQRSNTETMVQYISRKTVLFKELDKAACVLPDNAKGYLLLRDARLTDKSWDTVETWTKGTYELETIKDSLRKLERPVPGRGGKTHIVGLSGYAELTDEAGAQAEMYYQGYGAGFEDESGEVSSIYFMSESLFVVPEEFDDELLAEAMKDREKDDILYVAGDLNDDAQLLEDDAVAIFANYAQVRTYLHRKQLNRGFVRSGAP